jgi:predicted nucleic-acid-binding Zn-ribbon protein
LVITACPLCGSKSVGSAGIRDGVNPNEFLKQACKNCGWTGTPLEFDSEQDYHAFLKELIIDTKDLDDSAFADPAKQAPIKRYMIRGFWTSFLYILLFVIPGIVFFLISILFGLPNQIGIFFAFLSFFIYIYFFWKNELWNMIKR